MSDASKHHLLISGGNRPRTGDVASCVFCSKEFYRSPSSKNKKCCSTDCKDHAAHKGVSRFCEVCGDEFSRPISQEKHRGKGRFCTKVCKGVYMSRSQQGEKNPSWKGGISPILRRLRASKRFRDWRVAVFTRDDYTCQICKKRGGYLEPDHIKPFAYYPELRFDISNGRTLCKPCHKKTDTYGHKAKINYGKH